MTSETRVAARVAAIKARLSAPVIAAPMFLVSSPDLVIAACKAGIIGAFPTVNARTPEILEQWLARITAELGPSGTGAPWAANVIVHTTSPRFETDFPRVLRYKPEIVITSLGSPVRVVDQVHDYGGLVFSDVNSIAHARKAAAAGADGLVLVAAGAGGHSGAISPFALVPAVREFFDGPLVLGGSIMNGAAARAAEVLGADFAYMGTRFIAARESSAVDAYRDMLIGATEEDVLLTAQITGVPANFLVPSLRAAGLDPAVLAGAAGHKFDAAWESESKAWKDIWSAGHGVRAVKAVEPAADIIARIVAEYAAARARP